MMTLLIRFFLWICYTVFSVIPAEANTIIAAIADAVIAVKVNMPDDLLLL
jgi:hypothetical protein